MNIYLNVTDPPPSARHRSTVYDMYMNILGNMAFTLIIQEGDTEQVDKINKPDQSEYDLKPSLLNGIRHKSIKKRKHESNLMSIDPFLSSDNPIAGSWEATSGAVFRQVVFFPVRRVMLSKGYLGWQD